MNIKLIYLFILFTFGLSFFTFAQSNKGYNDFLQVEINGYSALLLQEQILFNNTDLVDTELSDIVDNISSMKKYLDYDPIDITDKALDQSTAFDKYLDLIAEQLDLSSDYIYILEHNMRIYKHQEETCRLQKQQFEKEFFRAFESYQGTFVSEAIQNTVQYEQCASDGRIKYNSYNTIYKKLQLYHNTLSRKYEYWTLNKYKIVDNAEFYY